MSFTYFSLYVWKKRESLNNLDIFKVGIYIRIIKKNSGGSQMSLKADEMLNLELLNL